MKLVSLIVALGLALASGAPAQPAPLAAAAGTAMGTGTVAAVARPVANRAADRLDAASASSAPGASTYLLLALGLFGMGLVSRRRQPD